MMLYCDSNVNINCRNDTYSNTPIQLRSRASSLALQYETPRVRFFSVWFSLGSIACVAVSIVEFTYSRKIVGNFLFIRSGIHIKSS